MSNRHWATMSLIFCMMLVSSVGFGQSEPEPVPIPSIETFMQIGSASGGQITHDGSMIFFESSISGVDQVYKLLPSGWPKSTRANSKRALRQHTKVCLTLISSLSHTILTRIQQVHSTRILPVFKDLNV